MVYTIPGMKVNYLGLGAMVVVMMGLAYLVHQLVEKRGAPVLKAALEKLEFKMPKIVLPRFMKS